MVEDLIKRSIDPCKTALKDAGLTAADIDDVILVGGQTRMPAVQEAVKNFFGKEPRKDVNPDEAVAVGAAIQGAVLSGDKTDVLLLDVTPLSLGIETLGGVFSKLIDKNTTIPAKKSQIFSTAEDNQTAVTIKVGQGERELFEHNKFLGLFNLEGIAPARRGMPQIEVTFDIDANGILSVSAQDKATNKEAKITIKANSGLSDAEIQQMIKDAELNAEADKQRVRLVQTKNSAESTVHQMRKDLEEHGSKITQDEKTKLEDALKELETAMTGEDIETINTAQTAVYTAAGPLFAAQAPKESTESKDDVVDAEFTEVKN